MSAPSADDGGLATAPLDCAGLLVPAFYPALEPGDVWCRCQGALLRQPASSCNRARRGSSTPRAELSTTVPRDIVVVEEPPEVPEEAGASTSPKSRRERCAPRSPGDASREAVERQLTALGFVGARAFVRSFPLAVIVTAIAEYEQAVEDGAAISNPGGFLRWLVKQDVAALERHLVHVAAGTPDELVPRSFGPRPGSTNSARASRLRSGRAG